jgi:hypothetical protein
MNSCNGPVNNWNRSLRSCPWLLQIARPNNRCTKYFLSRQCDRSHMICIQWFCLCPWNRYLLCKACKLPHFSRRCILLWRREHKTFVRQTIARILLDIVCKILNWMNPCNCPVNKWNKWFRRCWWFLQIARLNILNKTNFHFVLSCLHHNCHTKCYVCVRLTPCLQGTLCTQPHLLHLGTAREYTPRNTVRHRRSDNNQLGNRCTFQCRVHLGTFQRRILDRLSQGHHESFYNRRGRFHTTSYRVVW